jgi:hypothetical protein
MSELTDNERKQIQETHDTVIRLHALLIGSNGDEGICGDIKSLKDNIETLYSKHNRLSRNFYILVGILAGSGVLVSGLLGLFK